MEPLHRLLTALLESLSETKARKISLDLDNLRVTVRDLSDDTPLPEPVEPGIICPRQQAILDQLSREVVTTTKRLATLVGRKVTACFYRDLQNLQRGKSPKIMRVWGAHGGWKLLLPWWWVVDMVFVTI